jgi:hypothetical protein
MEIHRERGRTDRSREDHHETCASIRNGRGARWASRRRPPWQETTRSSVDAVGTEAATRLRLGISADGRPRRLLQRRDDLVVGDTNLKTDCFVRTRSPAR